jgi:hypothetical protein
MLHDLPAARTLPMQPVWFAGIVYAATAAASEPVTFGVPTRNDSVPVLRTLTVWDFVVLRVIVPKVTVLEESAKVEPAPVPLRATRC